MTNPKNLSIQEYTYSLPENKIASYPLVSRDDSKLLVYNDGIIAEDIYKNIATHIPEKSFLVFNNTKVMEARLLFQKPTGGIIELFCLEPHSQYADITTAMLQKEKVLWHCLVGGASKWKAGQLLEKQITIAGSDITLKARYIEKKADTFILELSWSPGVLSFAEVLHYAGAIPLPPYIKRAPEASDTDRYQTVYAQTNGSVAAPTAGLHFSENVFTSLLKKNIQPNFITLHVGAGTFKPVKSHIMQEHEMHAEFIDVSKSFIERLLKNLHDPVVAVGTTSLRTLESLYWLGVKQLAIGDSQSAAADIPFLSQWEAYQLAERNTTPEDSLLALLSWMQTNKLERLLAKTQILIAPGYSIKIADGLITNFHQPQSTLLLLVAALIGEQWKEVYAYALKNDFRFLSYGDGSLLWSKKS